MSNIPHKLRTLRGVAHGAYEVELLLRAGGDPYRPISVVSSRVGSPALKCRISANLPPAT